VLNTAETIDSIKKFLETLNNVEKDWDRVYEDIGKCDQEISDLLHEIELTDFDHVEGFQLSEEIQKVRRRRRDLKNYQEIMRHIKEYLDRNKSLKISLFKVFSSMERTFDYQMNRTYTPRVRTDLKLCSKENQNMMANQQYPEYEEEPQAYDEPFGLTDVFETEEAPPDDTADTEENNADEPEVTGDVRPLPCRSSEEKESRQEKEKTASA
jgi:hypothetical protein